MTDGYHMTPEDFRLKGYAVIDWLADYMETVADADIMPKVAPGAIGARIPAAAPEGPEPFEHIMSDLDEVVRPGLVHWQSPGWFAYFPANTSPPSILGDLVSSGLGQQGMLWSTSPACTEIENAVVDWMVDLLGLPSGWKTSGPGGGVIQMTASDSTHTALVVARNQQAARSPIERMVVYTSAQAHSSVEKGARIVGVPHTRLIPVDDQLAMRPEALAAAIANDLEAGYHPILVASTVGTTGTSAVDPLDSIGVVAREHGLWHHVDAAYAGSAMICPEFRIHQPGLDMVDSYTTNPHKWMFTNFDCSLFYVADRTSLIETMSIMPPYLRNPASDEGHVIDYRDWHVPLGRRFRALKLWFVLRSYGAEGIRHHIRHHVQLAKELEKRLSADDRFELVAPVPFALVTFRLTAGNDATDAVVDTINASGHSYVTPSKLGDMSIIRVSVGQTTTDREHVNRLWQVIDGAA